MANATAVAGDFHTDAELIQANVLAATTFAKGDVVYLDAADGTYKQATSASTAKGNYGIAAEAKASTSGNEKRRIVKNGHVLAVADGAIKPGARVTVGTTAGRVAAFNEGTGVFNSVVGNYVGKAASGGTERDGATITDAAAADIVWIALGPSGGGGF